MISSSELHGAATHLAMVAIPLWAVLAVLRRLHPEGRMVAAAEPWALGGGAIGVLIAGLTGLLVRGQAETTLRGNALHVGTWHFWLGIGLAVLVVVPAGLRLAAARRGRPLRAGAVVAAVAVVALVGALAQGFLGGRMTYHQAVGIEDGGQLAQSARGAAQLELAMAHGAPAVRAGRQAFSAGGLGCASCHGDKAQGLRGPPLAGGRELEEFRHVHGHGLFPPRIVSDRDFRVIDAYLRTLAAPARGGEGDGD